MALDNELNELSVASRKLYRQSTFATSFSVAAAATSAAAAAAQAAPASAAASLRDLLDEMDRGVAEPEEGEEGDGVASSSNRQLLLWQGPPDWVPKDRDKDGSLSPHLAEAMAARVAAAAAAAASAAAASRGPGPGPGAGMLALGDKVVRVSGVGDPGGAPAAAGLSEAAASAQGAGLGSALLAAVAPRFTPVQFAWVRCMARMSAELCHALPAVWSVCTSPRLTQSKADLSGASRKSIERAAALGRDLVSKAVAALVERAEDALQELSHAGPMQPCMELVMVVSLCGTRRCTPVCTLDNGFAVGAQSRYLQTGAGVTHPHQLTELQFGYQQQLTLVCACPAVALRTWHTPGTCCMMPAALMTASSP